MKALTYFEADVDYCALSYGLAPCQAVLVGGITRTYAANFQNNQLHGWAISGAGAFVAGADAATLTETTDAGIWNNATSINGVTERVIRIDAMRTAPRTGAGWDGKIFYATGGHGFSGSFYKQIPEAWLAVGVREVIELDMSALTVGGTDWITNTITAVRIDLDEGGGAFKIYAVTVGHIASAAEATGTRKCTNNRASCQDIANFADAGATMRFARNSESLPRTIDCIPNIASVKFTPGTVSLGENLGERSSLAVEFFDHRHSDTGPGGDKYRTERSFDPFKQGSFWPRFRARHPFLQGRDCRLIRGLLGQSLDGMDARHYIIETTDGPDAEGVFRIIAKDILKLADGDKAQAPSVSNGRVAADITVSSNVVRLTPMGVGDEYPTTGHLNLGGKEIVSYTRLPDATFLVHGDGADGPATPLTDAASLKPITKGGNCQVDTGQSKFGGASIEFDGVDDSFSPTAIGDQDFAFGTGPYSMDLWFRPRLTPANYQLVDFRFNLTDIAPSITMDGGNTVTFSIGNSAKITSGVVIAGVAWYHLALCRDAAGNTRLFINGNQTGSTYVGSENLIVGGTAARPLFGLRTDAALDFSGWIDEVRITKGRADFVANFTPPAGPYGADLGDNFQITRAAMNTTAQAHSIDERAQWVLQYAGANPANIISDLLQTYAGVPASYIPLSSWLVEVNAYLGNAYTANIAEPTSVANLISELILQAALALWWDDAARLIRLQVLRAIPVNAQRVTADNMMRDSLEVEEQPEKRISRVLTYFGQLNPLKNLDQLDNYRSSHLTVDDEAEADYGAVALKKIFSRWIPFGGRTIADRLNTVQLARYRDAPRHVAYKLLRYNEPLPALGAGYNLQAWCFQDDLGAPVDVPVEIIRLNPTDDEVEVEAEEMRFAGEPVDPNAHTIIIDSDAFNINLRTLHDSLFGAPVAGNVVRLVVQEGVIIGSTSPTVFSLVVGDWPAISPAIPITVAGTGRIQGRGGKGGGTAGPEPGSGALYTRRAINIDMAGGEIWGGGGGGGSGGFSTVPEILPVGGSGGQGQTPGAAGVSAFGFAGNPGTTEAPGAQSAPGGNTFAGGAGGASGANGNAGVGSGAQPGGLGGAAIDGVSFVTFVNAPDIDGGQIN